MSEYQNILDFFHLVDMSIEFNEYLDNPNSFRINRLAFAGDVILSFHLKLYLLQKYDEHDVGYLTNLTSIYVANVTMKAFLISMAPNDNRLCIMSAHSAGTIFEALLQNCNFQSIPIVIENYIDKINLLFNPLNIMNYTNIDNPSNILASETIFFKDIVQKITESLVIPAFNSFIKETSIKEMAYYIHENRMKNNFLHKENSIIAVEWKSRSKLRHIDNFYSCCGMNTKIQNEVCLRNYWKDKNSIHIGCLYIHSSSRVGGGITPRKLNTDHIPICKPVYWSCCNQESLTEGCTQLYEHK